jgi:hypothetical protein
MRENKMRVFHKWFIGVTLAFIVLVAATCGANGVKVNAEKPTHTVAPIDLSGVNWTELGRLMYGRCGEYHDLAISVGWSEAQWKKLSFVMYRESRCNTRAFNKTDPNGGSRGLIQINGFWCKPSKYNKSGWLQEQGALNTCEDLFIPEVNLRAGLAMWNYSQQRNKCGWQPWATRC